MRFTGAESITIVLDGSLAVATFWIIFFTVLALPCSGCESIEQGWTIRNQVPHPLAWAYGAAVVTPLLHQVVKARRRRGA